MIKLFDLLKNNCTSRNKDEGLALILTLWVLMILSVLILTYTMSVNSNIKNASYLKDKIQASAYAEGALYLVAVNLIMPDDKKDSNALAESNENDSKPSGTAAESEDSPAASSSTNKVDPKQIKWFYEKLGKWNIDPQKWTMVKFKDKNNSINIDKKPKLVTLVCEVSAEDSKFPLNNITQLDKSLLGAGVSPIVFGAIKIYLKKTKEKQSDSSLSSISKSSNVSDSHSNQSKGHKPTNTKEDYGSFKCVEELLEVENIDDDVYLGSVGTLGLKDIMTVFSDGKVYVSKAKEEVLSMVPGISSGAAGTIASQSITGKYLKSFNDLNAMIGANSADISKAKNWLSIIPKYFRIKAKSTVHGIMCTAECVVKIDKNDIKFVLMNRG